MLSPTVVCFVAAYKLAILHAEFGLKFLLPCLVNALRLCVMLCVMVCECVGWPPHGAWVIVRLG